MFGCKCSYCGCELKDETGKYMHVDHVEAIRRNWFSEGCLFPENNNKENLFPSCKRCNNYKSSMSVEIFRSEIKKAVERLNKIVSYRNAVRFGMIEAKEWDGIFWFEKFKPT